MTGAISRRRVLQIFAALGSLCLNPVRALAKAGMARTWRGVALGAEASITLYHPQAEGVLKQALAEVRRLEKVFSLYRADSALSALNRQGYLNQPPLDLVRLLTEARGISEATGGAFDVTVQPLWDLYARHFQTPHADPDGPRRDAIETASVLVDYRGIEVTSRRIALARPGMAITLNGIAQGYITDRIADLLCAHGLRHVLINLGEVRGLDGHPDGRPWLVGLEDAVEPHRIARTVELDNQAIATSAGHGTRFDRGGRHHHLFDPRSGISANRYLSVSIMAPNATVADALSTGFISMTPTQAKTTMKLYRPVTGYFTLPSGETARWSV